MASAGEVWTTKGGHYYVRLENGMDVDWEEQLKWDTREEAEKATKQFLGLDVTE